MLNAGFHSCAAVYSPCSITKVTRVPRERLFPSWQVSPPGEHRPRAITPLLPLEEEFLAPYKYRRLTSRAGQFILVRHFAISLHIVEKRNARKLHFLQDIFHYKLMRRLWWYSTAFIIKYFNFLFFKQAWERIYKAELLFFSLWRTIAPEGKVLMHVQMFLKWRITKRSLPLSRHANRHCISLLVRH